MNSLFQRGRNWVKNPWPYVFGLQSEGVAVFKCDKTEVHC
jgi:hypothetical protein